MDGYTVDSENGTDTSPWRGMTPVECMQMVMFYIQCVLRGSGCDKWFYQLPPQSFHPPFTTVTNEKMELYRQILSALNNPNEPVARSQLIHFYESALVTRLLPFITTHPTNGVSVSWFVNPEPANNRWYSVFLYSERLRTQVLSQDALYPLDDMGDAYDEVYEGGDYYDGRPRMRRQNWFSARNQTRPHDDSRTLEALDRIATLIKYIKNKGKFPCLQDWHFLHHARGEENAMDRRRGVPPKSQAHVAPDDWGPGAVRP